MYITNLERRWILPYLILTIYDFLYGRWYCGGNKRKETIYRLFY